MKKRSKKVKPYRYRYAKKCVCGKFLGRPSPDADRVTCTHCGQEHVVQ